MLDLNEFRRSLSRRLLMWGGLSTLLGLALILFGDAFWRGLGIQAAAWGIIDAGIAWVGLQREIEIKPGQSAPKALKLRRLLLINTGLDVLYVTAGLVAALTRGASDLSWRGHGWGVVAQGAFLFFFDLLHAQRVPLAPPELGLIRLEGPEHEPFFLRGGQQAALLVHGFLGSPAEMRPLGEALHRRGWTVQAPLLPGFGRDIPTLGDRRYEDWVATIEGALRSLQGEHAPIALIGFSLGGALALSVAARCSLPTVVLMAPFVQRNGWLGRSWRTLLSPFLPHYIQPLRHVDMSDPALRQGITDLAPQLDLDDPQTILALRELYVPVQVITEVWRTAEAGWAQARNLASRTLVVQGGQDHLVVPAITRELLGRLPPTTRYLELDAGHQLVSEDHAGWPALIGVISQFISDGTAEEQQPA